MAAVGATWRRSVYRLMTRPGRLVTVLSNSRENGAEFLLKCAEVCRIHNAPYETVVSPPELEFEDMRMELRLRNRGKVGRIKVLAANPRTARGFSGDLILDEFAFHENGQAIWEAAEPILASNRDYLCRIASTGNGKRNLFYRMVEEGISLTTDGHRSTRMGDGGKAPNSKDQAPENYQCPRTKDQGEVSSFQCSGFSGERSGTNGTEGIDAVAGSGGAGIGNLKLEISEQDGKEAPKSKGQGPENIQCPSAKDQGEVSSFQCSVEVKNGEAPLPNPPPTTASRGEGGDCVVGGVERVEGAGADAARTECDALPIGDLKLEISEGETGNCGGGERGSVFSGMGLATGKSPEPADRNVCPTGGGYVKEGVYYKAKAGFWVSRVTRSMAHGMGLEIYDSQTRKPITPEQARAQALDKRAYDQNYECSFADEALALLSHELISAAECDDAGEICEQDWSASAWERIRQSAGPLYGGLDVGRKVDMSVLTVIEKVGGICWIRGMLRMREMRLPEQETRLGQLCRLRQVRQVCIDMTGLGLGLFEYAQRNIGAHRICGINFASSVSATRVILEEGRKRETVRVTEALAMEVLRAYEDRRVRQPRDWELREDLRRPGKVTTPGGRVSIAAVRDGGGHADHFWSLALALEAAGGAQAPFAFQAIKLRPKWEGC